MVYRLPNGMSSGDKVASSRVKKPGSSSDSRRLNFPGVQGSVSARCFYAVILGRSMASVASRNTNLEL